MAKRKKQEDPFADYREWVEHRYNRYYFINRISWPYRQFLKNFGPNRYSRTLAGGLAIAWGVASLGVGLILYRRLFPAVIVLSDEIVPPALKILGNVIILAFCSIMFFGYLRVFILSFLLDPDEPEVEPVAGNPNKPKKKRGLPKRPKNYR